MEEKALLGAAQGGLSSQEYVDLCRWLASRLKQQCELEESITSGPGEPHPPHTSSVHDERENAAAQKSFSLNLPV